MAHVSVLMRSEVAEQNRIDSEFYRPEYLETACLLKMRAITPLHTVARISDGNHLKIAEDFLNEPGIRYLRGQDISSDMLIDDRNQIFIPESLFEVLQRSHILKNDVLITIVGANTGFIGLVYEPPDKLTANCKLGIVRPTNIAAGYLYAFLTSKYGQHQIQRARRGGGQTGLILPDLRSLVIARLGENTEHLISKRVLRAHKLFEKSIQAYETAEKLLLMELNLNNWRPNRVLTFTKHLPSISKEGRLDAEHFHPKFQEMFSKLSPGIKLTPLKKLGFFTKGTEVGREEYTDSGISFWRVSNLAKRGLDRSNLMFISEELYQELRERYEPSEGELLLSKDATPGIALYLDMPVAGIVSAGILRISLTNNILPYYLEMTLNSLFVQLQIEQEVGGSVIRHWKLSSVMRTLIPRLSPEKESNISKMVQRSHVARRKAKALLQKAKKQIEIAIEENNANGVD